MVENQQQMELRLPDEVTLTLVIADEIGRLPAKMSVALKLQSLAPQTEKVSFLRRIFKW